LIGMVTGVTDDVIGIAARLTPAEYARKLKARWALSLGVWNSGGADEYYLDELDRFFKEDETLIRFLSCTAQESMAGRLSRW
jgi:hypothetical protein